MVESIIALDDEPHLRDQVVLAQARPGLECDVDHRVILVVGTDPVETVPHGQAGPFDRRGRAHTRQHQDLRRVEDAGGEDDLIALECFDVARGRDLDTADP